jgi:hypothetical protein
MERKVRLAMIGCGLRGMALLHTYFSGRGHQRRFQSLTGQDGDRRPLSII